MEVLDLAVGGVAVDRHAVGGNRQPTDVLVAGSGDAGVLVQGIGGVTGRAPVSPVDIPTRAGGLPVADVVVVVAKLLAGGGRPVGPVMAGAH